MCTRYGSVPLNGDPPNLRITVAHTGTGSSYDQNTARKNRGTNYKTVKLDTPLMHMPHTLQAMLHKSFK